MSARVKLLREPTDGWHVTSLPPWIAPASSRPGRYWHQPRSASLHGERVRVAFWCGQMGSVDLHRLRGLPPEDLKCGTCIGRRMGYDRENGAVFTPRDHFKLPTRCPGVTWEPPDFKVCIACGERVKSSPGWNSWGSANHRPGPALSDRVAVCPRHGWRNMYQGVESGRGTGFFHCRYWQCGWSGSLDRESQA